MQAAKAGRPSSRLQDPGRAGLLRLCLPWILTRHPLSDEPRLMMFHHTTLANGLEVIAELNDRAHSVAAGFFVKTGSRDEMADLAGVSHFLEHMTFKGTPRRDALTVNRDFDRVGAKH